MCAWTAARTWTTGEVPTAAMLNLDNRDNLDDLGDHRHGGAAGDGSAALDGVFSTTFAVVTDRAAPGAGRTVMWVRSGGGADRGHLFFREGAAGSPVEIADQNHKHTLSQDALSEEILQTQIGFNVDIGLSLATSALTTDANVDYVLSEDAMVFAAAVWCLDPQSVGGSGIDLSLVVEGVEVDSQLGITGIEGIHVLKGTRWLAAGARDALARIQNHDGGTNACLRSCGLAIVATRVTGITQ